MKLDEILERLENLEKETLAIYAKHPKPSTLAGAPPAHRPGTDATCEHCIKIRSRYNVLNNFFKEHFGVTPNESNPRSMVQFIRGVVKKMKEDGEL